MELLRKLKPFDRKSGNLNVVIDTPKGCRNKYAFDFEINAYKLKSVLPHGTVFPFDFGSIPGTVAEDGDPLDVLVLMDEPVFIGCLVETRLLGCDVAGHKHPAEGPLRHRVSRQHLAEQTIGEPA